MLYFQPIVQLVYSLTIGRATPSPARQLNEENRMNEVLTVSSQTMMQRDRASASLGMIVHLRKAQCQR